MHRPPAIAPTALAAGRCVAVAAVLTATGVVTAALGPAVPPPASGAPAAGAIQSPPETGPAGTPAASDAPDPPAPPEIRQVLVRPGQDLEAELAGAGPGDEFILWPGTYAGAVADGLVGEVGRPITIRGLRPDDPPVIEGGPWGLRLHGASHVVLEDLVIRRPRIDGIEIRPLDGAEACGPVQIRGVRIEDVGDRAGRHGVHLRLVRGVRIDELDVRGWTGSGLELVGCEDVLVERTTLVGRDRGELLGLRLRAGCRHVVIRETRIEATGRGGIVLGGRSRARDFPQWTDPMGRDRLRWEVADPTLEDVLVREVDVALTLLGVTRAAIYNLTLDGPRRAFLRISRPSDDSEAGVLDATIIGRSLFAASESHPDPRPFELAPGVQDEGLWLEENLWWRPGGFDPETTFPGSSSFQQTVTVDPRLDETGRVQAAAAAGFGARLTPVSRADAAPAG